MIIINWTATSTGDTSTFSGYSNQRSLDESIIRDLSDAYVGVDGITFPIEKKKVIDDFHKEYFKLVLIEDSIKNVLKGKNSLKQSYETFYSEQFPQNIKNEKVGLISRIVGSKKLPDEDSRFFNNLECISKYLKGENVDDISNKIDYVIGYRQKAFDALNLDGGELINSLKEFVMSKRYDFVASEFSSNLELLKGTIGLVSVIDNFVDGALNIFNDFKFVNASEDYKKNIFNIAYWHYSNLIVNPDIPDVKDAVFALNNVHERIFGTKQELVNLEFSNGRCAYYLNQNPYVVQ